MSCGDIPDGLVTEEQGEALMPRKKKVQRPDKALCQKCKASKSMYIIRNVTYCKGCFETSVFMRFMKTLHPPMKSESSTNDPNYKPTINQGGTRPSQQKGNVLIGLSGGSGSICLLNLLVEKEYLGKNDNKIIDKKKGEKEPLWKKGYVLHVDFSDLIEDKSSEDRSEVLKKWVEEKQNGLVWIGLKAHEVFDPDLKNKLRGIAGLPTEEGEGEERLAIDLKNPDLTLFPIPSTSTSTSTPLERLRTLLTSLPAPSRPSLLSSILNSLLTIVSETISDISHILLGETSTRQAQRLIAGTALGKGYTLPLELSITTKSQNIIRLKPMKDLTTKEVAIYTYLKGLNGELVRNGRKWDNSGHSGKTEKKDSRGKGDTKSLESLTEQFIASLGVTHPATVSTINRTGDKLMFTGKKDEEVSCPICQMPVDPNALEWKSRTALTSLPNKTIPENLISEKSSEESLATMLCYACLTTFTPPTVVSKVVKDQVAPVNLPLYVSENVNKRKTVGRQEMKDQIKGFLIDEE